MRDADYLIVGQGIAGSMLAWFLLKAGQKVIIVDEYNPNSASQIASGIINPITGKRLVKSWRIDELLPFAIETYRDIEKIFGINILNEKTICRIFSNKEDQQFFRQKHELEELPENIKPIKEFPACFRETSLGGVEISGVYQLDYALLLKTLRTWFIGKGIMLEEKFQFAKLQLKGERILYGDLSASKIIFCEGSDAKGNPYFPDLPFNLAKGEILIVKMPGFPEDRIWHKGVFIAPLGNELFRVGSTYEWDFEDGLPSEKGKEELVKKLSKAVNLEFQVVEHYAAIRPTVADRRPLLGFHPRHPQLGIFNGLGTKGASLAPFFANQFVEGLINGKNLDKEVVNERFERD